MGLFGTSRISSASPRRSTSLVITAVMYFRSMGFLGTLGRCWAPRRGWGARPGPTGAQEPEGPGPCLKRAILTMLVTPSTSAPSPGFLAGVRRYLMVMSTSLQPSGGVGCGSMCQQPRLQPGCWDVASYCRIRPTGLRVGQADVASTATASPGKGSEGRSSPRT